MSNKHKLLLFIAVLSISTSANAHPGHDHGHWMSGLLHTLFYASLIAAAAACLYAVKKTLTKRALIQSSEDKE